jgi:hypothetical protein
MAAALLTGGAPPAAAGTITLEGLTFSDELGGFVLVEGRGSGRLDDPFVLVEEITGDGPAIMTIRGLSPDFGNRIGSHHAAGFAVTKVVRNGTEQSWSAYNLELREIVTLHSPYEDGLSFGQASSAGRPFASDRYSAATEHDEPYDGVSFSGGLVRPGETAVFSFVVTDALPKPLIFLLQKRSAPIAGVAPDDIADRVVIVSR